VLLQVGGDVLTDLLRFQQQFGKQIPFIARPPDADTATLRGAAQYELAKRTLVSTVILPEVVYYEGADFLVGRLVWFVCSLTS
jgi:hypothetical protein